jgi:hypothetical protein
MNGTILWFRYEEERKEIVLMGKIIMMQYRPKYFWENIDFFPQEGQTYGLQGETNKSFCVFMPELQCGHLFMIYLYFFDLMCGLPIAIVSFLAEESELHNRTIMRVIMLYLI